MYSQPNEFQMPRTLPSYPIHHHHQQQPNHNHHNHHHHHHHHQQLLEQQLQVFQHFQAFRQQQVEALPIVDNEAPYCPQEGDMKGSEEPRESSIISITNTTTTTTQTNTNISGNANAHISSTPPSANRRASRGKSKRIRTIFTPEQLKRLEQEFSNQMYLVGHDRCFLASSLHLSEAQVKVWFQNRRIKFRKLHPGTTPVREDPGSPSTGDSNSAGEEARVSSSFNAAASSSSTLSSSNSTSSS